MRDIEERCRENVKRINYLGNKIVKMRRGDGNAPFPGVARESVVTVTLDGFTNFRCYLEDRQL